MEISEILEHIDIVEYVGQYCELEERSDGEFWGLSPLKDENTPSFSVNPEKQTFYDFSSGQGGDVLNFVRTYHNCGLRRAIDILKKWANISDDVEVSSQRLAATSIAKQFRARKSGQTKEVSHTILPPNYMERYDRDPEKLAVWEAEGITRESMKRFQVRYDPVDNRLVYPVRDALGNIINVGGRTLDPDFKAKKLRKYTYYKSFGTLDTIYGLAENMEFIKAAGEIVLFEGAKSVMVADGWGVRNTGAVLTSHLNPQQFKLLIQLGVSVVFAFDAEVDIRSDQNAMKLKPYLPVYWLRNDGSLEDKDAPVDKGYEVFKALYQKRIRLR